MTFNVVNFSLIIKTGKTSKNVRTVRTRAPINVKTKVTFILNFPCLSKTAERTPKANIKLAIVFRCKEM